MTGGGTLIRGGALSMQVCVPKEWTDEQVREYAERRNPCGTESGWQIRRDGDPQLKGAPERAQCDEEPGRVHIMLDA